MDIKKYLQDNSVEFTIETHVPQYTAQEVAATEHISGYMFAKVVVIKADNRFVMAVTPAPRLIDTEKLRHILGAETVRLAEEREMEALFPDCEVGAEPPFGNLYDLETLLDYQLALHEDIVMQAGTHRETIRMRYADYARLVRPTVADFTVPTPMPVG